MRALKAILLLMILPSISFAQGYSNSRAKSWEFSIGGIYQMGDSANDGAGSSLDVDDAFGLGLNLAYNFTDHFSIGADLDFVKPDYKAVLVNQDDPTDVVNVDHNFSQFNGRLKATLNLLDGPFVPFIEVGAGWTYIDSNVADGPPQTGCWWHPWWGYICSNFWSTFSETTTTYGGNLGLRYEFVGNSYLKASYGLWKLDGDNTDPELESFRLEYGWRF